MFLRDIGSAESPPSVPDVVSCISLPLSGDCAGSSLGTEAADFCCSKGPSMSVLE